MVVQQAMAAGIAVIATRVGGIPHMIEHYETGLIADAGNVEQLAAFLSVIASDASIASVIGKRAKAVAMARYRAGAVARSTRTVYQSSLAAL